MSQVITPVPGLVAKINVKQGDQVSAGQVVALVQCMKTEIPVVTETAGVVTAIMAEEGGEVEPEGVILEIS